MNILRLRWHFWGQRRQSRLDPSHPGGWAAKSWVAGVEPEGQCPQGFRGQIVPKPLVSRVVADSKDVHRCGLET